VHPKCTVHNLDDSHEDDCVVHYCYCYCNYLLSLLIIPDDDGRDLKIILENGLLEDDDDDDNDSRGKSKK
jgi:hypothetical protein